MNTLNIAERIFTLDNYPRHLGIELVEAGKGYCKAKLHVKKGFLNAAGVIHGGMLFSLADVAFAVVSTSHGKWLGNLVRHAGTLEIRVNPPE